MRHDSFATLGKGHCKLKFVKGLAEQPQWRIRLSKRARDLPVCLLRRRSGGGPRRTAAAARGIAGHCSGGRLRSATRAYPPGGTRRPAPLLRCTQLVCEALGELHRAYATHSRCCPLGRQTACHTGRACACACALRARAARAHAARRSSANARRCLLLP